MVVAITLNKETPNIDKIEVVREFLEIFLKDLPGLPPQHKVEFSIELEMGTRPFVKAPYNMAPIELEKLRVQLYELLKFR